MFLSLDSFFHLSSERDIRNYIFGRCHLILAKYAFISVEQTLQPPS